MQLRSITFKNIKRYFKSFDKESFVKTSKERTEIIEELRNSEKDGLIQKLSQEQRDYVDTIFETYFQYMPISLQQKFYLYCLNEELKTRSPEELLFDTFNTEPKDFELIENPVEDFYTVSKEFNKLVAESTKDIDIGKLAQQNSQQPNKGEAASEEKQEPVQTRFKVEVVGIDSAKKLTIIKEVKSMLSVGLKEVS